MDHPLLREDQLHLRRRVVQILSSKYSSLERGNIIFVCGGNKRKHMRVQFRNYCGVHKPNYLIFQPEFAMESYFTEAGDEQFDIADFERLIGELSHAIVVFPEAPGSYAEVGYFSAIENLTTKIVLSLDSSYQDSDSFISLGPAKRIGEKTRFHPIVQTDYKLPDFSVITSRIDRVPFSKKRKQLVASTFDELSEYDLFCLIHQIFNLLKVATYSDMRFIVRAIFKNRLKERRLKQITSILVGSKLLLQVGKFGHYYTNPDFGPLLEIIAGNGDEENLIKLEITSLIISSDSAFRKIARARRHAS